MKIKKMLKNFISEFKNQKEKTNLDEKQNLKNKLEDVSQKQIDKNTKEKEYDETIKLINM